MKDRKLELKEIELSKIDPNPENSQLFKMSNIEHLANIINEEGFTTPIEVFQKEDGRYEITSGHRRYEAMKLLKRKTIPCCVTDKYDSSTQKDRKLLSSNIATRKLSPLEMANAITFYKDILKKEKYKGNTRTKTAEYFGISESNVYRYECLLKLIPELQEFCKKPQFPYSSLRQAASLTEEEQKELYNELLRLEASNSERLSSEDVLDEIDKDEIIFSRTRIEQIINNKIRIIEKNQIDTSEKMVPEQIPLPKVDEKKSGSSEDDAFSIDDLIIPEEMPALDIDDIEIDESYLKGFDECINTLKAYTNNAQTISNKDAVLKKISELKKALEKIESIL